MSVAISKRAAMATQICASFTLKPGSRSLRGTHHVADIGLGGIMQQRVTRVCRRDQVAGQYVVLATAVVGLGVTRGSADVRQCMGDLIHHHHAGLRRQQVKVLSRLGEDPA